MLTDRRALVTGSVSGLGYAIAESLAKAGASVVINGLCDSATGEAAAARLAASAGVDVVFDGTDLSDPAAIEHMFANARARFGGVDIVVNNAVVRHFAPIEELSTSQWNNSLAVNVSAAFHCARLALPGMRQKDWGRIINLSSIFGSRGAENRIDYVTTKTALLGMTRAIAVETARTGITCNAIAPGVVPSPAIVDRIAQVAASEGISHAEAERQYLKPRHPTERFVALENVGALAAFLCSPAARDITGATLPMDGGWQAR